MKKTAILLAAAATFLASITVTAPASAASFNWGFNTPWLGYHANRSLSSHHYSGRDRVHIGPFSFNVGLSLGRSHVERCYARYRSYNEWSDVYFTYGGVPKRCRL